MPLASSQTLTENYIEILKSMENSGLPSQLSWQRICLHCRRPRFNSWVRKICWRRDRLPTPVFLGFPCGSAGKESSCNVGDLASIPGGGMATHSSIFLPGESAWTEEPCGLKSIGSRRVRYDWMTWKKKFCHSFPSKEWASFNFMAWVTVHSDFGAQENKICYCFHVFHILFAIKWWDRMTWSWFLI